MENTFVSFFFSFLVFVNGWKKISHFRAAIFFLKRSFEISITFIINFKVSVFRIILFIKYESGIFFVDKTKFETEYRYQKSTNKQSSHLFAHSTWHLSIWQFVNLSLDTCHRLLRESKILRRGIVNFERRIIFQSSREFRMSRTKIREKWKLARKSARTMDRLKYKRNVIFLQRTRRFFGVRDKISFNCESDL